MLILRVAAERDVSLSISADGREAGVLEVPAGTWVERSVELPAPEADAEASIEVVAMNGGRFSSFHYWLYALERAWGKPPP